MKHLQFILILISLSLCIACERSTGEADSLDTNQVSDSLMEADSVALLIESLGKQIIMFPKNPSLYIERSYLLYTSGKTAQAIEDIEKAIQLNEKDPEAHYLRGYYALVSNQDSLAKDYLLKAVAYGSENPETYFSLGNLYVFQKNYPEAMNWYAVAMKKDSLDPNYPFAMGMLYYQQKQYPRALKWYEQALELDPYFSKALVQMYAYYSDVQGNMGKAMEYNHRLLQLDSLHPVGRFHLAAQLQEKAFLAGRKKNARAEYDSLMMKAIDEYSKALRRNPTYVQALYNRGYAFYALSMYDEAMFDFEKVLGVDKFHARTYFMMASIYEFRQDFENAKKFFEIALQLQPDFKDAQTAIRELEIKMK